MSNMKCPFCGQELKNINFMWFCENESCRAYDWTMEEAAWQELIRTRKAFELAITGLKNCKTRDHIGAVCRTPEYVDKILEQITALEQKDEQC